jgi:hypothetical protein
MRRAYSAWQGEGRIWLLPWISESFRWRSKISIRHKASHAKDAPEASAPYRLRELAIRSERFDRIDLVHIDPDGRVFAPTLDLPFLRAHDCRIPKGVYLQWIEQPGLEFVTSKGWIELEVPNLRGGSVEFERVRLRQQPGPILPCGKVGQQTGLVWPPLGSDLPRAISPEAENIGYYGRLWFSKGGEGCAVLSDLQPDMRALHLNPRWPSPFDQFFPHGGGADLLACYEQIRECAQTPGMLPSKVLSMAEPYFSEGESTEADCWFWPRLCADGETNILADVESKFDWHGESLSALFQNLDFQRSMNILKPNQRIWGWPGYFWFELLTDLRSGKAIRACERCGGPIQGKASKRFCGRDDNPDCFRQRRAANKRAERSRVEAVHEP